jgi:DNA-binding MarR family transcriptional regulator
MTDEVREQIQYLYNPQRFSGRQLLDEFIDRDRHLQNILEIVRQNTADRPQQHVILIGARGMGKTTLLCALRHSVEQDAGLAAQWLPIQLAEEQNNFGDLADFWLECLTILELACRIFPSVAEQLRLDNAPQLATRAQTEFYRLLDTTGKRALLLVDNIQDVLADINDGLALHQLRALWMTDPRMTVIGAAPSMFGEISEMDQAFHDFFRLFYLDRLNRNDFEQYLRQYAQLHGDQQVLDVITNKPERMEALRIMSGGNFRLIKLGYQVLREDGDLYQDLEKLLDNVTPFFRDIIKNFRAKEARRTFDAIARHWDPVSVDDIRRDLRQPSNYVSAQINRLVKEGFVEVVSGDKVKRYQLSERLYNLYYLWRIDRDGRKRLRWIIPFMQAFYCRKDFIHWSRKLEKELSASISEDKRQQKLQHLNALCEASDNLKFHWQAVLPLAAAKIADSPNDAENLRILLTDLLLNEAVNDHKHHVRVALEALEPASQAIFEPLLIALQAEQDRSILYRIAREKRDLVLDVMQRINPSEEPKRQ